MTEEGTSKVKYFLQTHHQRKDKNAQSCQCLFDEVHSSNGVCLNCSKPVAFKPQHHTFMRFEQAGKKQNVLNQSTITHISPISNISNNQIHNQNIIYLEDNTEQVKVNTLQTMQQRLNQISKNYGSPKNKRKGGTPLFVQQ